MFLNYDKILSLLLKFIESSLVVDHFEKGKYKQQQRVIHLCIIELSSKLKAQKVHERNGQS